MERSRPYLDPGLTIDDLADDLDIPAAHLTMVLSLHLRHSFCQFVNRYRVRENRTTPWEYRESASAGITAASGPT